MILQKIYFVEGFYFLLFHMIDAMYINMYIHFVLEYVCNVHNKYFFDA